MADRTFVGDPNPPPQTPRQAAAPAEVSMSIGPSATPPAPAAPASPEAPARPSTVAYSAVDNGDGSIDIMASSPYSAPVTVRTVRTANAGDILTASGSSYREDMKVWENIPERVAQDFINEEISFPQYLLKKYQANKHVIASGVTWNEFLAGRMTLDEARARGDVEQLQTQVKEAPLFVWQGSTAATVSKMWEDLKAAGPVAAGERVLGEVSGQAAFLTDSPMLAATGLAIVAPLAASAATPVAGAAVATALGTFLSYGGGAIMLRRTYQIEGGNAAAELDKKGVDPALIKDIAPLVGIANGVLETVSFHMMTAPMRRAFAGQVFKSEIVKKVMANALVNYTKELGGEITTEMAQERVNIFAENTAAEIENNPKAKVDSVEGWMRTLSVGAAAGMGAAGLQAGMHVGEQALGAISSRKPSLPAGAPETATPGTGASVPETKGVESLVGTVEAPAGSSSPYPKSVTEHPAFVKAVEEARPALGNIDPMDKRAVIDEYVTVKNDVHDYANEVTPLLNAKDLTPEKEAQVSSKMHDLAMKMAALGPLARIAFNDETAVRAHLDDPSVRLTDPANVELGPLSPETQIEQLRAEYEAGQVTPEYFNSEIDRLHAEQEVQTLKETGAPATGALEQKVSEAQRTARLAALDKELGNVQTQIAEGRKELVKALPTDKAAIVDRLTKARMKEAQIQKDLAYYKSGDAETPTRGEDLLLRPAALEDIVDAGFKAGREAAIAESKTKRNARAREIRDVARRLELTARDVRMLLKDADLGMMSDVQFRHWLENKYKPGAVELFRHRVAQQAVQVKQAEKQLENERNARLLYKLPPVAKMTTEQLKQYLDILDTYDARDKVLSPRRVRALDTTVGAGARTMGEVLKKVRDMWDHPLDSMARLLPEPTIFPDTARALAGLVARSPFYKAALHVLNAASEKYDLEAHELSKKNQELGAAALASRKGFFARKLLPTMPEVRLHLETDPVLVYTGEKTLPTLTPEEQTYVSFLREAFDRGYEYLQRSDDLQSRFEGLYLTHVQRDIREVVAGLKDVGLRKTLTELYDRWIPDPKKFTVVDQKGNPVGVRKHIKFMEFRSDKMAPSENVIHAADTYFRTLAKKKALDAAVPFIDTAVDAALWADKDRTADGLQRKAAFEKFMGQYLSMRMGGSIVSDALPRGGLFDSILRASMALPSWAWIAFNPKLQVTAKIGEVAATMQVTGMFGWANAQRLRFYDKTSRIFQKYESFTGTPVWTKLQASGKTTQETAGLLMYGLLQAHRVHAMQDVLISMMTPEEYEAETISPERLAEIKTVASRWMDVEGANSVLGATTPGAALTQMKSWGLPILRTTIEDFKALGEQLLGREKMTPLQQLELQRLLTNGAVLSGLAMFATSGLDEEDKSERAKFLRGLARELLSVTGGANPFWALAVPPGIGYYIRAYQALELTLKRTEFTTGEHEGELRGPAAAKKLLPGAALARSLAPSEEE